MHFAAMIDLKKMIKLLGKIRVIDVHSLPDNELSHSRFLRNKADGWCCIYRIYSAAVYTMTGES